MERLSRQALHYPLETDATIAGQLRSLRDDRPTTGYLPRLTIRSKNTAFGLLRAAGRSAPAAVRREARRAWTRMKLLTGRVRLGVGVEPLSEQWGADRGEPICRYYLAQFLTEFARDIRGHSLEFHDAGYTQAFGGSAVTKTDVLHIDESNPAATIVADLTKPNDIPSDQFDTIICTHVLHVIFALDKAVAELYRILKPGGVLLVAVPHVSMCGPEWHEIWRFTAEGLHALLGEAFGMEQVTVRAYGNSLTAAGQIRGLVTSEFTKTELDTHDLRFAVEICARAVKPARAGSSRL